MEGIAKGRIVHYVLTEADAVTITDRRVPGVGHGESWPAGAQAHVGNPVEAGEHIPAMIVEIFGDNGCINLHCILDGNDSFWATSRLPDLEDKAPGTWHWIEKA